MTTAREVIEATLTFGLNRLSPGETLDADTADTCLTALNFIVDRWNGQKAFLFREVLTTSSAITGTYGTLGTDWTGLSAGDEILGATVRYSTNLDVPMQPMTMGRYADVGIKTLTTYPAYYAHDGQVTVYLYPAAAGHVITLRTKQVVSEFADLDTDYVMPKGYKSALSAELAEMMAPTMIGGITPAIAASARAARARVMAQNVSPAIINASDPATNLVRIKRGF